MQPQQDGGDSYDSERDIDQLHKALYPPLDLDTVGRILANRSMAQMLDICRHFKIVHDMKLQRLMKLKLKGRVQQLLRAVTRRPSVLAARSLRWAMQKDSPKDAFIDILPTLDPDDIEKISNAYTLLFKRDILRDTMAYQEGSFGLLAVRLLAADRQSFGPDADQLESDVQTLSSAGDRMLGGDEAPLDEIVCSRPLRHIAAVAAEYRRRNGRSLLSAIGSKTDDDDMDDKDDKDEDYDDYRRLLSGVVLFATNPTAHAAGQFRRAVREVGRNDRRLQRAVAMHRLAEALPEIKAEYQRMSGRSLGEALAKATAGDYRMLLLALLKENSP